MEVYYRYGFWFLVSLPLAALSVVWQWADYLYLLTFLLASFDLIFVREQKQYSEMATSVNHYQFFSRINILNLGLTLWLSVTLLVYALGIKTLRILPLLISWGLASYLLRRYIARISMLIEKWLFISYLSQKLPQIPHPSLVLAMRNYPQPLPGVKNLAALAKINETEAERLLHYYQVYYESIQRENY